MNQAEQKRVQKAIASARAALGQSFDNIALMCHLLPVQSWTKWRDPYGNYLNIGKNNRVTIGSSKYKAHDIHDIYAKSTFELISNNSYWLLLLTDNTNHIFWFLGNDGILRCASFNEFWIVHEPLLSGFEVLKMIAEEFTNDEPRVISGLNKLKVKLIDGFLPKLGYMTEWPTNNNEILNMLEESKVVE